MSVALCVPSAPMVESIARFVVGAGYTEEQLKKHGLTKVPWRKPAIRSVLDYKVPANTSFNLLLRLFWFGEAASVEEISSILPHQMVESLVTCKMLEPEAGNLTPQCMLVHSEGMLLACDSVRRARVETSPDLVLGVNTPAKLLAHSLINPPDADVLDDVLDLGTGCGTLALGVAHSARTVIATDINPRALAFTQFNTALNGVTNVQVCHGDRFEPVKNRKFDLIACNPPFFLAAKARLQYTDNPAELDSFVESLARLAPGFLKPGGFFQMLCEWVELEQEPWRNRLKQWFDKSGCDVLVLKAYERSPADYALTRAGESASLYGEASEAMLLEHVEYFRQRLVRKICGGLVTMRRRVAVTNWILFEEMEEMPHESIGGFLQERFENQDVLACTSSSDLLNSKPRLSSGVQLIEESTQQGQSWKSKRIYVERRKGLQRKLAFDREIANLIVRFDGAMPVDRVIRELAKEKNLSYEEVSANVMRLLRKLSSLGLITLSR